MKKMNKKGFTIVELVIVIVVIAILAAVLIPTFVSLTRKANIANDTAVAKNLNTAAIAAQADTFDEAYAAARDAGYLVANLNAKASGCYFVWEDDSKQFLLYDLDAKKILYSNTDVKGDPDASWFFAVNNPAGAEAVKAVWKDATIKTLLASVKDVADVLAAGGEVYIDESLVLDKSNLLVFNTDKDVVINLGDASLNTSGILAEEAANIVPVEVMKGNVTINGGYISTSGAATNADGLPITVAMRTREGSTVVIEGTTFENTNTKGQIKIGGTGTMKDVEVKSTKTGVETFLNGVLTLENVNIQVTKGRDTTDYRGACVWACNYDHEGFGGTGDHTGTSVVTIKSGTYTSEKSASYTTLTSCGGTIIVEDGTFTEINGGALFTLGSNTTGKIVITGGTFNGVPFAEIDSVDEWEALCNGTGYNVGIADDGTVTITK